jgi:tetratricopeptide (TPR) repeat protein
MASFWQDDPAEAERQLRPGYEALKRLGEKSHFSAFAHELAVFVYRQGRYEEAGRMAEESQDASRPNDVNAHIVASSTRAKVLAQAGDHEAAARLAREAVAFAAASDFIPAHASALMDLAEVLRLGGDPAAAAIAMEEAIPLYERKGNVVGTARARAALAG